MAHASWLPWLTTALFCLAPCQWVAAQSVAAATGGPDVGTMGSLKLKDLDAARTLQLGRAIQPGSLLNGDAIPPSRRLGGPGCNNCGEVGGGTQGGGIPRTFPPADVGGGTTGGSSGNPAAKCAAKGGLWVPPTCYVSGGR